MKVTRNLLKELVTAEVARLGGEGHRVFLGGLSQGCAVALDTYVRLAPKLHLGGFVGSVGFVPSDELGFLGASRCFKRLAADEQQAQRPVWIQCAIDDDEEVPWKSLVLPSVRRAKQVMPGLQVREVSGRGHAIDEWEEEFLNEFVKAHASFAYR